MHKGIVLLKRAPELSPEEFEEWFLGPHLDFSRSRPEVRRYTGSVVVAEGPDSPWIDGEPAFDIVSEIWCDSLEDVQSAFAALRQMGGVKDSKSVSSVRIALIAEEHLVFDR